MEMIDWSKPLRLVQSNMHLHYIGKDSGGRHMVETPHKTYLYANEAGQTVKHGLVENVPEMVTIPGHWIGVREGRIVCEMRDDSYRAMYNGVEAWVFVQAREVPKGSGLAAQTRVHIDSKA